MRTERYSLLGILLAAASSGSAIEPAKLFAIQKGPMVLKPQLQTALTFTDNVNYREEDKLEDVLATISPGLALQVGSLDDNFLNFSYFYDRLQYFQHEEFNANQHRISLQSHVEKSRFTLDGRDEISLLSSPLGGGFSLAGQMVDRTTYFDYYRLSYDLSERTQPYLAATHSATDYEEGIPLYDSRTILGTLGFGYLAFSQTYVFGEVYYGITTNDRNAERLAEYPDATYVGGFLGVRGRFTEKLSGTVKAGYQYREYAEDGGNAASPVVDASLSYAFSEATQFTLAYARRQEESAQFVRTAYVSDSVSASVRQQIGADGRLNALLSGNLLRYQYDRPTIRAGDRVDYLASSGLTITYDVKLWMRVFGGYNFEWLDSSEPVVVDYTVNRIRLGLELGY